MVLEIQSLLRVSENCWDQGEHKELSDKMMWILFNNYANNSSSSLFRDWR